MSEEKLRACPFCGAHPEANEHTGGTDYGHPYNDCMLSGLDIDEVAWNTRPTTPDISALVSALEGIADMTDVEADFDGFEARAIARKALQAHKAGGAS